MEVEETHSEEEEIQVVHESESETTSEMPNAEALPMNGSRAQQDRELIRKAKDGNQKAYEKLMHQYRKSVYYLILKMVRNPYDAEDIAQESFAKAFASLHSFDTKYAFSTWLFRIATNNCIDFIRKQRMQMLSINTPVKNDEEGTAPIEIRDNELLGYEKMFRQQRKEFLDKAIAELPPRYQMLIELRYFQELSYEEVAEQLQIPLGTVKAQLHRARELLNEALSGMEGTL